MNEKNIMPTPNMRIKELIHNKFNGNVRAFATHLGISNSQKINRLFLIDKRSGKYPTASIRILELISNKFYIPIESLTNNHSTPILNEDTTLCKSNTGSQNTYIPLLPVSAQGGSFSDFLVSIKNNDCEKITSPILGAEFAMSVAGDSMSPEYPSGAQILIKKINERAFIDWGKVYVLDTCNGIVIKKLMPTSNNDTVKCVSINPSYPEFDVCLADVYGIYRVLMCMSIK